jgi:pentatricopeptide repeat protein
MFAAMQAADCTPDATTYDSIISAHSQQEQFKEALSVLEEMREAGCR